MAYKQNPGRGNRKKTGYGIPQVFDQSPMQQEKGTNPKTSQFRRFRNTNISEELENKVNEVSAENKLRLATEKQAKIDSTLASRGRMGTDYQNAMAGNKAANATRSKAGYGDMNVNKGRNTEGKITYMRNNMVEKNFPRAIKNQKTGEYGFDPKENLYQKAKNWITTAFTTAD
jgi:hypothetical protein